jgi:hypothetical protein
LAFKEQRNLCHSLTLMAWCGCIAVSVFLLGFFAFAS